MKRRHSKIRLPGFGMPAFLRVFPAIRWEIVKSAFFLEFAVVSCYTY